MVRETAMMHQMNRVAQRVTQVVDIALRRRLLVVIWYACTRRGFVTVTTIVEIEVTRQNSSVELTAACTRSFAAKTTSAFPNGKSVTV